MIRRSSFYGLENIRECFRAPIGLRYRHIGRSYTVEKIKTVSTRVKAMRKKEIEHFKKILTAQLEELLEQADDTVSGMTAPKENFPDPTDRASLEADRNFLLRIRDRESKLIKKIKKTLERIENGTFGVCESCGENISTKRMKARPVTTQCIECKTKEEALEKALGI